MTYSRKEEVCTLTPVPQQGTDQGHQLDPITPQELREHLDLLEHT